MNVLHQKSNSTKVNIGAIVRIYNRWHQFKKMRKSLKILVLLTLISFSSIGLKIKTEYDPFMIIIKGTAKNLTTDKSIKNTEIYIDDKRLDEIEFDPNDILIKKSKTNLTGQFMFRYYINKSNRQFWIKIEEFAQINIKNIPFDTTKLSQIVQ
jgi:hypothetical protein